MPMISKGYMGSYAGSYVDGKRNQADEQITRREKAERLSQARDCIFSFKASCRNYAIRFIVCILTTRHTSDATNEIRPYWL